MNIELSPEVIAGLQAVAALLGEPLTTDPRDLVVLVALISNLDEVDRFFPASGAHRVLNHLERQIDGWARDRVDHRAE